MPNSCPPPETLDYTIDLLHNELDALKQCCLVSKSWVPRTRKHLFADIKFRSASDLESWKKTFPDAANSPAYHARSLLVGCPLLVVASDAEEGGWIRAFSGVASLGVDNGGRYIYPREISLAPFYGFSPTLKSLCVRHIHLPDPQIFDLVRSFPLLENLRLRGRNFEAVGNDGDPHRLQTIIPSTLAPSLTGSLDLAILGGVWTAGRQLLDLPNRPHFRKFACLWDYEEDLGWIMGLVVMCSQTLEFLDITCTSCRTSDGIFIRSKTLILFLVVPESASLNFSKVTKLREVVFRPESKNVDWITMALQTITPSHRDLRQISVYVPFHLTRANVGQGIGEVPLGSWSDLDCLLVQLWESRSIRPRVGYARQEWQGQSAEYSIGCLFSEATKRGIIDPL